MKSFFKKFLAVLCVAFAETILAAGAVLETDTFRYEIGEDGKNISFFDKISRTEYLRQDEVSFCAQVTIEGNVHFAASAELNSGTLCLTFEGTPVTAALKTESAHGRLLFEIAEVTGEPDKFVFASVPLTLEAKPFEPFAACALALTPFTHVDQLPALHTAYFAEAVGRHGLVGAKAALIGVPQPDILSVIQETMNRDAEGFPFSDKGGAWALTSKDGMGSYLMNFGSLTEETSDSWIESCRRLGFNQIDNHGGGFFSFGSLENLQPGGWDAFKRIIDKCHAAGIQVILHTYSCYINKNDRYVTPVPHPDLDTWQDWTLAEPLDAEADEIIVLESIDSDVLKEGWNATSSRTLRLGNEIIQFSDVTREAPWKFLGCKRGFHGTSIAEHDAGSKASLLKTYWNGLYVPRLESSLWYEIAKNHADVVNRCGFDGLYFDAIDGLSKMWGSEDYWYYGGKFVLTVAGELQRPVGMEFSAMIHPWWHYRSRYQAWDTPSRGFKRFLDIHLALIKGCPVYPVNSEIDTYARLKNGKYYLPFQLGWWMLTRWGDPKCEPTYSDDIDYIGCKLVGNNAGFSFNHSIDIEDPFLAGCADRLRDYLDARHDDLDESILAKLREPKKEYALFRDTEGRPCFREMFYKKHKISDAADPSSDWIVENEFETQPLSLRLVSLFSIETSDFPEKERRFDPADISRVCKGNRGVTGILELDAGTVPTTGESAFAFTATNAGDVPDKAAWVQTESWNMPDSEKAKNFRATGFWLCGDGQGEILNVQVGSSCQLVPIDFTGWKYIELLEGDVNRVLDYDWPGSVCALYSFFRENGDPAVCSLWFNNVPAGKTVRCLFGPIAALPYRDSELKNPIVTVNQDAIRIPATLESGSYFELRGGKGVKYGKDGIFQEVIPLTDPIPLLKKGDNRIRVSAEPSPPASRRMELTVIGEGDCLE